MKYLFILIFMASFTTTTNLVNGSRPVFIGPEKGKQIRDVIEKFSIDTSSASSISFSEDLHDRGSARVGHAFFAARCDVTIGPMAFLSEEVLASTLAHEVEVHCKQGIKRFFLSEEELEKEAYDHEIKNQARFKTSDSFVAEVRDLYRLNYEDARIHLAADNSMGTTQKSPWTPNKQSQESDQNDQNKQ